VWDGAKFLNDDNFPEEAYCPHIRLGEEERILDVSKENNCSEERLIIITRNQKR